MLPGDLLCKFMKERLEENLEFFKDLVKRDLDRQPEKVNLQVDHLACMCLTPNPAPVPFQSLPAKQRRCSRHEHRVSEMHYAAQQRRHAFSAVALERLAWMLCLHCRTRIT